MKSFNTPIFDVKICVFDDLVKATEYCKKLGMEDDAGECKAWVFDGGGTVFMAFDKDQLSHGVLAHEAYHAARAVTRHAGIRVHKEDEELHAYLLEYIANKCAALL